MPSGRISKQDQETILEALEQRRYGIEQGLWRARRDGTPWSVIWNLEKKSKAVIAAIHTTRDTMEVYEPCAECGGTGFVVADESPQLYPLEEPQPVECPVCFGNIEQRTCPQCETPLRESAAGNWNCPFCGWSSIKGGTR